MLLVWCWTVANLASSPERLRVLMRTWAYAAVCWAVILFIGVMGHIALITGATAREGSRTSLTLIDPNYSASYYFISIMLIWATGYPRRRSVRIVAYVLLIAAIASTGSNSGIVSLVVGSTVAATMAVYHRRGVAAAVSVGVVFALAGFAFASTVKLSAIQQA